MATIDLTLSVCRECRQAMRCCFSAMTEMFAVSAELEAVLDRFPGLFQRDASGGFDVVRDFFDAFISGCGCGAKVRAGHGLLALQPSELFREFMTALAREINVEIVEVHGWPVLSLELRPSNVTEAEALKKGLGGGFPHDLAGEAA